MEKYRIRLLKTFLWKISCELKLYKYRVLLLEKEEIYARAYETDTIISIYEELRERSQKMTIRQLKNCLQVPDLLALFYSEWLRAPDSRDKELEASIMNTLKKTQQNVA